MTSLDNAKNACVCYCPQKLQIADVTASLVVGDVRHGSIGCVPMPGHKSRAHAPLTNAERVALYGAGFPWAPDYWPTLRANGSMPVSALTALRSACVKLGIGYFDGRRTVGRLVNRTA